MNISIIGPENSGKSTYAAWYAKRARGKRPIYMLGGYNSKFPTITLEQFGQVENCVIIIDDANATLDSYEFNRKNSPMRKPNYQHRHMNRLHIYVFHSMDDSIKKVFAQSKAVYISEMYRDSSFKSHKNLKGVTPKLVGFKGFQFLEYKRY